jgi:RNA polymerase sigma-70 factor, ECF subfamily
MPLPCYGEMGGDDCARREPEGPGYRPGSREDFDRLYSAVYPRIFRTLAAMLGDAAAAEDCTQEAFLQAFKAWSRWKRDAPAEAWVHRIAINAAISYRRKQRLREVGEVVRRIGIPPQEDPQDAALEGSLVQELRRLPARQAATLVLRHLHGYTNREIAVALGVPESTIASRLWEARRSLRKRLQGPPAAVPDTPESLRVSIYK